VAWVVHTPGNLIWHWYESRCRIRARIIRHPRVLPFAHALLIVRGSHSLDGFSTCGPQLVAFPKVLGANYACFPIRDLGGTVPVVATPTGADAVPRGSWLGTPTRRGAFGLRGVFKVDGDRAAPLTCDPGEDLLKVITAYVPGATPPLGTGTRAAPPPERGAVVRSERQAHPHAAPDGADDGGDAAGRGCGGRGHSGDLLGLDLISTS